MRAEVSVIIPTYRPPPSFKDLLDALARQRADFPYEIIVVDDASGDGHYAELDAIVRSHGGGKASLRRLERNSGPARARNYGVAQSLGTMFLFIDSDCFLYDDAYLARARKVLNADKERIVGGTIFGVGEGYVAFSDHYCHWITNLPGYTGSAPEPHVVSTNMLMTRAVWDRIGPFDETLRSGEDVDLCFRARAAGLRLWLTDELRIGHYDRERLGDYVRNYFFCGSYRHSFYGRYDRGRRLVTGGPRWLRALLIPVVAAALSIRYLRGFWSTDKKVVFALPGIVVACFAMAVGLAAGLRSDVAQRNAGSIGRPALASRDRASCTDGEKQRI